MKMGQANKASEPIFIVFVYQYRVKDVSPRSTKSSMFSSPLVWRLERVSDRCVKRPIPPVRQKWSRSSNGQCCKSWGVVQSDVTIPAIGRRNANKKHKWTQALRLPDSRPPKLPRTVTLERGMRQNECLPRPAPPPRHRQDCGRQWRNALTT